MSNETLSDFRPGVEGSPPTGPAGTPTPLKPLTLLPVSDSDPRVTRLADKHYSRKTVGASRIAGPGEHLILTDRIGSFVLGFRKCLYRKDGQVGVECFIFRNEGQALSSFLLVRALPFVRARWKTSRLFTYISPRKVSSPNPGYCFKMAGWKLCGENKWRKPCERKIILEYLCNA